MSVSAATENLFYKNKRYIKSVSITYASREIGYDNFGCQEKIGYKRMADALGYYSDERRGVPAISLGEVASNL